MECRGTTWRKKKRKNNNEELMFECQNQIGRTFFFRWIRIRRHKLHFSDAKEWNEFTSQFSLMLETKNFIIVGNKRSLSRAFQQNEGEKKNYNPCSSHIQSPPRTPFYCEQRFLRKKDFQPKMLLMTMWSSENCLVKLAKLTNKWWHIISALLKYFHIASNEIVYSVYTN